MAHPLVAHTQVSRRSLVGATGDLLERNIKPTGRDLTHGTLDMVSGTFQMSLTFEMVEQPET